MFGKLNTPRHASSVKRSRHRPGPTIKQCSAELSRRRLGLANASLMVPRRRVYSSGGGWSSRNYLHSPTERSPLDSRSRPLIKHQTHVAFVFVDNPPPDVFFRGKFALSLGVVSQAHAFDTAPRAGTPEEIFPALIIFWSHQSQRAACSDRGVTRVCTSKTAVRMNVVSAPHAQCFIPRIQKCVATCNKCLRYQPCIFNENVTATRERRRLLPCDAGVSFPF